MCMEAKRMTMSTRIVELLPRVRPAAENLPPPDFSMRLQFPFPTFSPSNASTRHTQAHDKRFDGGRVSKEWLVNSIAI
jgi:hypothetical protein